jgi:fatty-acid desaturase
MFKTISKALWFSFLPLVILGMLGIILIILNYIPSWYLIFSVIMWTLISGLGIAVGYHRVFSHRTHKLPKWKENIILFFATFAGQGSPIFWVAVHRGYHHPHSDTEKDLHSPVTHSKFHAFIGWFIKNTEANNIVNLKYSIDLMRKPNVVWFHNNHYKILWSIPILVALVNWQLAFVLFWIPGFIGTLQDNIVNVYGHYKGSFGYRNFNTNDQSQNNIWLGWFAWGQGWHNNHHYKASEFDFGKNISGKWWELDPCKIFLLFLK